MAVAPPPGLHHSSDPESATCSRERRRVALACKELSASILSKFESLEMRIDGLQNNILAILGALTPFQVPPQRHCSSPTLTWCYWQPCPPPVTCHLAPSEQGQCEAYDLSAGDVMSSEVQAKFDAQLDTLTALVNEIARSHQKGPKVEAEVQANLQGAWEEMKGAVPQPVVYGGSKGEDHAGVVEEAEQEGEDEERVPKESVDEKVLHGRRSVLSNGYPEVVDEKAGHNTKEEVKDAENEAEHRKQGPVMPPTEGQKDAVEEAEESVAEAGKDYQVGWAATAAVDDIEEKDGIASAHAGSDGEVVPPWATWFEATIATMSAELKAEMKAKAAVSEVVREHCGEVHGDDLSRKHRERKRQS